MEYDYSNVEYYQLTDVEMANITLGNRYKYKYGSRADIYDLMHRGRRLIMRSPVMIFKPYIGNYPAHFYVKNGKIGETPVFPEVLRRVSDRVYDLSRDVSHTAKYHGLIFYERIPSMESFTIHHTLFCPSIQDCMSESDIGVGMGQFLCPNMDLCCWPFNIWFTLEYDRKDNLVELVARVAMARLNFVNSRRCNQRD